MESDRCECACSEFRPLHKRTVEHIQRFKSFPDLYKDGCKSAIIENYWRKRILFSYSRRILTKSTDKLIAITAVASRLQSEFGLTYLAGLWKDDLIRELLWSIDYSGDSTGFVPMRQESYYAPTWSWVSIDAPMSWRPFGNGEEIQEPLGQFLETSNRPSTLNPFGPVSEGQIKLSALVWPVTAIYKDKYRRWKIFDAETDEPFTKYIIGGTIVFDTMSRVSIEKGELTQHLSATRLCQGEEDDQRIYKIPVTAMPLLMTWNSESYFRSIYGLIIQKSVTSDGFFERLGFFYRSDTIYEVNVESLAWQEIVLI